MCVEISENMEELLDKLEGGKGLLALNVDLPGADKPIEIRGKPAWGSGKIDWVQRPSGKSAVLLVGLAFEGLSDEVREQIHTFIVDQFVNNYGQSR
jgi:hypothetical protein